MTRRGANAPCGANSSFPPPFVTFVRRPSATPPSSTAAIRLYLLRSTCHEEDQPLPFANCSAIHLHTVHTGTGADAPDDFSQHRAGVGQCTHLCDWRCDADERRNL